jgi:hypothetical protein
VNIINIHVWTILFQANMIHSSEIYHSQNNISKPPRKLESYSDNLKGLLLIHNSHHLSHTYYDFTVIKNTLWLLQTTWTVNAANVCMMLLVLVTKCMAYEFSYTVFCIRRPNFRMLLYDPFWVKMAISPFVQSSTIMLLIAL